MQPSIVNNKYLAGQKKGLFFFAFKSLPPSLPSPHLSPSTSSLFLPLHLAGFTCWQRLRHQHDNGFIGLCCWLNRETSHHTYTHTACTTSPNSVIAVNVLCQNVFLFCLYGFHLCWISFPLIFLYFFSLALYLFSIGKCQEEALLLSVASKTRMKSFSFFLRWLYYKQLESMQIVKLKWYSWRLCLGVKSKACWKKRKEKKLKTMQLRLPSAHVNSQPFKKKVIARFLR